ncbi:MAG TPA: DNA starvation/stationary phase protection protein [Gemmatimonadaceae bacterium]|nr:DNA starvation/stationary phase protection protein [Gemmatimonadaceae bacterium]
MTDQPKQVIEGLNALLADATVFYQKLRHYHWNVAGPEFFTLHEKFELLYTAWADSIDQVAERILMIGGTPLHTLASMLKASRINEDETIPAAPEMVDALIADMRSLRARAGEVMTLAEAADDRGTTNLLDDLGDALEKEIWMLGAWQKATIATWS